jgi:hypothetical protein
MHTFHASVVLTPGKMASGTPLAGEWLGSRVGTEPEEEDEKGGGGKQYDDESEEVTVEEEDDEGEEG